MTAQDVLRESLRRFFHDDEMADALLEDLEEIGSYHDDGTFVVYPQESDR